MLRGTARTLFNQKEKQCVTLAEVLDLLRSWYNSEDKQGRLLAEWHNMLLSKAIEEQPDESETPVF